MNGAHNLRRWNVENITSNSHIKLSEPKKKGDSWCEGDFKDILPNRLLIVSNLWQRKQIKNSANMELLITYIWYQALARLDPF